MDLRHVFGIGLIATLAFPVFASTTPHLRPDNLFFEPSKIVRAPYSIPRPQTRPDGFREDIINLAQTPLELFQPKPRPAALRMAMGSRKGLKSKKYTKSGSVCGQKGIRGTAMARIGGGASRCGISAPVRVTEIDGVKLRAAATIDCTTAKAVQKWLQKRAQPAFSRQGGIREMNVVASYACRNRNSAKKGKLSEHAKGKAIDIAGFTLGNGQKVTVLSGWNDRKFSKPLRKSHKGACGIFGTVLGPNANAQHRDHFHFDTASYRSGSYCR